MGIDERSVELLLEAEEQLERGGTVAVENLCPRRPAPSAVRASRGALAPSLRRRSLTGQGLTPPARPGRGSPRGPWSIVLYTISPIAFSYVIVIGVTKQSREDLWIVAALSPRRGE
jgi:hypothetical protein